MVYGQESQDQIILHKNFHDLYSVMLPVCRELNEITIICPWRSFNIKDQVHLIILKKLAATR